MVLLEDHETWKFNQRSIQKITVSNLLNCLESFNFYLYLHRNKRKLWNIERLSLTPKIKIKKEQKFGNNTISEHYLINWKFSTKSMPVLLNLLMHKLFLTKDKILTYPKRKYIIKQNLLNKTRKKYIFPTSCITIL